MLQLLRKLYYKLFERYVCPVCNGTGEDALLKHFKIASKTCVGCWKEKTLSRYELVKLYREKSIHELRQLDSLDFIELLERSRVR